MAWAEVATAKTIATATNLIIASSDWGPPSRGWSIPEIRRGFFYLTKAIDISLAEAKMLEAALDHQLNALFKTL